MKYCRCSKIKAIASILFATAGLCAATNQITVAVIDFAQLQTGQDQKPHRWLSKAFSDLLIGDLAVHDNLRVVTRENMQLLMQEADLREKFGMTEDRMDPDEYLRMRQYLKVDQMVLGTFSIKDDQIRIEARIIDHETGEIPAVFSQTGALADALDLEKKLARDMLHYYSGGEIPADAWDLPKWTDSMEASELLYDGVDAFDAGQYNLAWYCFRRAAQVDPDYADAVYWVARMYYYRQDYTHAHAAYSGFVRRFPGHSRVGDAVAEYVHSRECGALSPETALAYRHPESEPYRDRERFTPEKALEFYRSLRAYDWGDAYVHNKVDYVSRSPLSDWLMKREQQALTYMGRLPDAFALLEQGLQSTPEDPDDPVARSWRSESSRLMSAIAMESEDAQGQRLTSEFLNAKDYLMSLENPVVGEDLRGSELKGDIYRWGTNWRILAPPGYSFKTVRTEIFRTNDPDVRSTCRLQIRRYRYVDIAGSSTTDRGPNEGKRYETTIEMPPGITWFYLRPEYYGRGGAKQASFDGWRLTAEFVPIPEDAGGVLIDVENAHEHNTYINGIYTRCFNGIVGNLEPGKYKLKIGPMWRRKIWSFDDLKREIEIRPNEIKHLQLRLSLNDELRSAGWNDPVPIASRYPTYKHRPRPNINWLSGPPSVCVCPKTGRYLAVWSHLDTLWYSLSEDGAVWSEPDTLPPPVNSADAETNPRVIIDDQGRYVLLFLSNRGMFRNLAAYISWSRNMKRWSRPIMINHHHHLDNDLIQNADGQYLLLLTFSETSLEDGRAQNGIITLQTSRDLVEWSSPVQLDAWYNSRARGLEGEARETVIRTSKPSKARIVQDGFGTYHLVWLCAPWRNNDVWRSSSQNLEDWSEPDPVFHSLRSAPYNISIAADDDRLMAAMISSDGFYSGHEMFALSSIPLCEESGRMMWRTIEFPTITVNGMTCIIYDAARKQTALAWQVAEQELHASRISGPVYVMTGRPSLRPLKPMAFKAFHVRTGRTLDKFVAKIKNREDLSDKDREVLQKCWSDYSEWYKKERDDQKATDADHAAHYINAWKMAVIDPRNHGGWPIRHFRVKRNFNILRHQFEAGVEDSELPAALICSALFNDSVHEAVRDYTQLKENNPFLAEFVLQSVQRLATNQGGMFRNNPGAVAAARKFCSMAD